MARRSQRYDLIVSFDQRVFGDESPAESRRLLWESWPARKGSRSNFNSSEKAALFFTIAQANLNRSDAASSVRKGVGSPYW